MPGRKRGRKAAPSAPPVGVITGPALAEAVPHSDRIPSPEGSRAHKKRRSASPGPLLEGFRSITARRTASPARNEASDGIKGHRHRSASPVLGPMMSGGRPRLLANRKPFNRYSPPAEPKAAKLHSLPESSRRNKTSEPAMMSSRRVTRRMANARSP